MDRREVRLTEAHVAPLMALVREWREREHLEVPNVDPNDGGVHARMLVLLESPGPRAVGTGFVSRDNPDPSARNIGRLLDGAGFARAEVLLWNVVPFCVSTVTRNRNASRAQIVAAVPKTSAFIDRVRDLRVIVFAGRRAQMARPFLGVPERVLCIETFHPGAMAYNRAALRAHMHAAFARARACIPG
jgi:hypothetical protein